MDTVFKLHGMHSTIVSNRVPVFLSTFGLRCLLWRGYSCSILQLIPLILMVSLRVPTSAYNVIYGAYTKAYGMIILGSHLFRLLEFFFFFFDSHHCASNLELLTVISSLLYYWNLLSSRRGQPSLAVTCDSLGVE